jgi:chaperonin GroES
MLISDFPNSTPLAIPWVNDYIEARRSSSSGEDSFFRPHRGDGITFQIQGEEEPMNVKPLGDRILVKRIEEEEKTKGGIIIPDTAKEKPIQGKVIAVGKGKVADDGKVIPLEVKEGDRILFGRYAGTEVKIDGEEHLIMREDEVLGIIEE